MDPFDATGQIAVISVAGLAAASDACITHFEALAQRCLEIAQSDHIRVVVLECHGPGAMENMENLRRILKSNPAPFPDRQLLIDALAVIPQPIIATIDGDALGMGLEAVLACDIRIATENSRFGLPQIQEGTMPCFGGTQRLVRTVGKGAALEMLLTGDPIDAAQAERIGLVNKVVSAADLQSVAGKMAVAMSAKGPISLQYAKEAVSCGLELTLEQGLSLEADLYFLLHTTQDRTEGVRAFQEKRAAHFKGN